MRRRSWRNGRIKARGDGSGGSRGGEPGGKSGGSRGARAAWWRSAAIRGESEGRSRRERSDDGKRGDDRKRPMTETDRRVAYGDDRKRLRAASTAMIEAQRRWP